MKRAFIITAAYLCVAMVHAWFVTYGTWELLGSEWLSSSFDSLGERLLQGRADINPATIKWEGLQREGKVYPYFGPLPAFLRVVFNAVWPGHYGQWARISCLLAATLSTFAFGFASRIALKANPLLSERQRTLAECLLIVAFGLGTPILYLVSCGRIYHEAILWGVSGGLWGLAAITLLAYRPDEEKRALMIFSIAFSVALLSRVTFSLPMCLISVVLFFRGFRLRRSGLRLITMRALLFTPVVAAWAIQLWYNYQRFEAPFVFLDYRYFYLDPSKIGGEFNLLRIPSSLRNYFGIVPDFFSPSLPFVRLATTESYRPDLFMQGWREQTLSLSIGSVWLVILAVCGFVQILARRVPPILALYSVCLLAEALLVMSYLFVTQRYAGDIVPLLSLLTLIAIASGSFSAKRFALLSLLAVASAVTTMGSTLEWNMTYNGDAPKVYKDKLARLFHPYLVTFDDSKPVVYLSDLVPTAQAFTFKAAQRDRSAMEGPLMVNGITVPKGLGMHSRASITFAVPNAMEGFRSLVALSPDVRGCDKAAVQFEVQNDRGETLFKSSVMGPRAEPEVVDVKLGGATSVSLLVHDGGNGINCDHAHWLWAAFYK